MALTYHNLAKRPTQVLWIQALTIQAMNGALSTQVLWIQALTIQAIDGALPTKVLWI